MTKNDARNEALVKQIEQKEKALVKPNAQLKTNCSLTLFGTTQNLNVCNMEQLILLKVQLNTMVLSAKDLGLSATDVTIGGFSIADWMRDIDVKVEVCKYNEDKKKLDQMKTNLKKLLSEDRRTEMALDNIEDILKGM